MIRRRQTTLASILICLLMAIVLGLGNGKIYAAERVIHLEDFWTSDSGDGVTDDTAVFQKALQAARGGTIYIPKPSAAYSVSNLIIPSDTHIVFEAGTVVQANANLPVNKPLFKISHAANVTIDGNGASFGMLKSQYRNGFIGEGTHTFSIIHSANVVLNGIQVTSSGGGDGFYINNDSNVIISNCSAANCLRNGLSLIGASGAIIENCSFYRNGDGIHVEPNGPADILNDIVVQNCLAEDNRGYGISISLDKYKNASARMDINVSFSDITTRNNGSTGLLIGVYNFNFGIGGAVNVNNYTSDGDKLAINISNSGELSPVVTINGWRIENPSDYHIAKANYRDAAWIRDMNGITLGRILFNSAE